MLTNTRYSSELNPSPKSQTNSSHLKHHSFAAFLIIMLVAFFNSQFCMAGDIESYNLNGFLSVADFGMTKDELLATVELAPFLSTSTTVMYNTESTGNVTYHFDNDLLVEVANDFPKRDSSEADELLNHLRSVTMHALTEWLASEPISVYLEYIGQEDPRNFKSYGAKWETPSSACYLYVSSENSEIVGRFRVTSNEYQTDELSASSTFEITIPKGEYVIGQHIPAGEYSLSFVDSMASFFEYDADYKLKTSYTVKDGEDVGRIVLEDGQIVEVNYGSVRMIPFTGF